MASHFASLWKEGFRVTALPAVPVVQACLLPVTIAGNQSFSRVTNIAVLGPVQTYPDILESAFCCLFVCFFFSLSNCRESRFICRESDRGKRGSEVRHKTYSTFTTYLKYR